MSVLPGAFSWFGLPLLKTTLDCTVAIWARETKHQKQSPALSWRQPQDRAASRLSGLRQLQVEDGKLRDEKKAHGCSRRNEHRLPPKRQ